MMEKFGIAAIILWELVAIVIVFVLAYGFLFTVILRAGGVE
ncbi:MAG: hypothetical protein ACREYF_07350 [Gammaproteobacteria bacterium]